jgi:hypothetical protein
MGVGAQRTRAGLEAVQSWGVGTGAAVTRGAPETAMRGPGAALSREVGTGAAVTHGAPELPCEPGGGNRSRGDTRRP